MDDGYKKYVLSVMGPHAGEDEAAIFDRKISDIERVGKTFWLCQSPGARPDRAQPFFNGDDGMVLFVAPSTPRGARPTTHATAMREFSYDHNRWAALPDCLSPVTGQPKSATYALVLSWLSVCHNEGTHLWQYVGIDGKPIRFRLGASTLLAKWGGIQSLGDTSTHPDRMRSPERRLIAIARLAKPYSVWVR